MKKFFLFALVTFFAGAAYSQGASKEKKDSLMKKMSREACKEITANKADITEENLEMSLGLIMMRLMSDNATELQDAFQLDMTDQESMTKFSHDLGMNLVLECPEFMRMVADKKTLPSVEKNEKKTSSFTGSFEKLVPGDITYFQVRASNGKIEKVYWMEYFEGANLLAGKIKTDRKITVRYYEKEVYNASLKEYVTIKVAAGVSEN